MQHSTSEFNRFLLLIRDSLIKFNKCIYKCVCACTQTIHTLRKEQIGLQTHHSGQTEPFIGQERRLTGGEDKLQSVTDVNLGNVQFH